MKKGVSEQQTQQLLNIAARCRPQCTVCRVPKHTVTNSGATVHSSHLDGPGVSAPGVGVCCLSPGAVPQCTECSPIWRTARTV
jgi:hypothetical protein